MAITLTERAQRLAQKNGCAPRANRGMLALMPLCAAATASAQTANFGAPTHDSQSVGGQGTQQLNSDTTQAQLLDGDTHLKIFGGATIDSTNNSSGSSFDWQFSWIGQWDTAPNAGDPFSISYDGTFTFNSSGQSADTSWSLTVDLDLDGNADYFAQDSTTGVNPVMLFNGNAIIPAPVSGAFSYAIYLDVALGPEFNSNVPSAGVTIDLPQNSIDLSAVPEASTATLFIMAAALLALFRIRRRTRRPSG